MEVIIMRIATLFAIFALIGFVAGASATTNINPNIKDGSSVSGTPYDGGRTEGDTIEEAWVIGALPFTGNDNTCGFVDDYDEVCPYSGSTAPDVVYAFTPSGDMEIDIDLCYSTYDTKVFVYEDYWTPGAPYACNDDFHFSAPCYTYSSKIECLNVYAGHTYYIVVDGYYGSCGNFQLDVDMCEPCIVECPPGAIMEDEPPCEDDWSDIWNGGCNSSPYVFETIEPAGGDQIVLCGTGGTYLYFGSSYRDTDWYEITVTETNTLTYCLTGQFNSYAFLIDGNYGCGGLVILASGGAACGVPICLTATVGPGIYWLWAGTSDFSGWPCGSPYVLTLDGFTGGGTPAETSTWGSIKGMFK
jgi:hypothetical protein